MKKEIYDFIACIEKWYRCSNFAIVVEVLGSFRSTLLYLKTIRATVSTFSICTKRLSARRHFLPFMGSSFVLISFPDVFSLEQGLQKFTALTFEESLCRLAGLMIYKSFINLQTALTANTSISTIYEVYHKGHFMLYKLIIQVHASIYALIAISCAIPALYAATLWGIPSNYSRLLSFYRSTAYDHTQGMLIA